jgi:hypothetical protein
VLATAFNMTPKHFPVQSVLKEWFLSLQEQMILFCQIA